MAYTVTEICNLSLGYCFQDATISNINEDSPAAVRLKKIYLPTLKRLLQMSAWSFSSKVVKLSLKEVESDAGFEFVYQYPSAALNVRKVEMKDFMFTPRSYGNEVNEFRPFPSADGLSKEIHSNISDAYALIDVEIASETILTPLFVEYFAYELAYLLSARYAISAEEKKLVYANRENAKTEAFEAESLQRKTKFDSYNAYVESRG